MKIDKRLNLYILLDKNWWTHEQNITQTILLEDDALHMLSGNILQKMVGMWSFVCSF